MTITIRNEQFALFADVTRKLYIDRVAAFLNQRFPDFEKIPKDEFRDEVASQIERAEAHGLCTEQQVGTYVLTAWLMGSDFDVRNPPAAAILDASIPPEAKANRLAAWATACCREIER